MPGLRTGLNSTITVAVDRQSNGVVLFLLGVHLINRLLKMVQLVRGLLDNHNGDSVAKPLIGSLMTIKRTQGKILV
jgi:hypothetical protein